MTPTFARRRMPPAILLGLLLGSVAISPALGRLLPADESLPAGAADADHLVISEISTGAASASDEFVELFNPTLAPLALDGLELVYVSASGATVTRKAAWDAGSPTIPGGGHLLIANAAGVYAAIGDATYANGLAGSGGSVALRASADAIAVDAVGWGTATAWFEGTPAGAPAAGESLERLPGGALGSGQDTDDNSVDFVVSTTPDPQNAGSPPIAVGSPAPSASPTASPSASATGTPTPTPSPAPTGTPSATPLPTPTPTPLATPTPSPSPSASATPSPTPSASASPSPSPLPLVSVAEARALPDGSPAHVAGTALVASDFVDGGGCVSDGTAGIAVLPDGAAFARGDLVDAIGAVDDRYAQRTLRVTSGDLAVTGSAVDPAPTLATTGAVGEGQECRLVRLSGAIQGTPTSLSSGLAYELDDGSGPVRVLVGPATGIDTGAWVREARVTLVGVVGQRDSSGTGMAGYRVQPRDPIDVLAVDPPATPSPSASSSPSPTSSPTPPADLVTIAAARAAEPGARVRVRGVVIMANGLVDQPTAVIADGTAAIVLRMGDGAGTLRRGSFVEVAGTRSTKSGMETIRTDDPPSLLGTQAEPAAVRGTTGGLGEAREAQLVTVRGAVTIGIARSTAGNMAFTLDDGSGPLRVTLFAAAGFPEAVVASGDWVEVTGVLGQVTTGAQPDRGYHLWPREPGDLHIVAAATDGGPSTSAAPSSGGAASRAGSGVPGSRAGSPGQSPRPSLPAPQTVVHGAGGGSVTAGIGRVPRPDSKPASNAAGSIELTANRAGAVPALALLLLAAALCLPLAAVAWRGGGLSRLAALAVAAIGSEVRADPEASQEEDAAEQVAGTASGGG